MPVEKVTVWFEDIELPHFNELVKCQSQELHISAYAQDSLTTMTNHLRCALVIGESSGLPLKLQAPAVGKVLLALAEDLGQMALNPKLKK